MASTAMDWKDEMERMLAKYNRVARFYLGNIKFAKVESLKKHAMKHIGDFPFHCNSCSRGFSQNTEKEAHEKECLERRYECHLCKKFIAFDLTPLKIHLRMHTGAKPYHCKICMNRFARKEVLKRHLNGVHGKMTWSKVKPAVRFTKPRIFYSKIMIFKINFNKNWFCPHQKYKF